MATMKRRQFLKKTIAFPLLANGILSIRSMAAPKIYAEHLNKRNLPMYQNYSEKKRHKDPLIRLFLCGDVMTGRGIDQILPNPSEPQIYESYMRNALGYVYLAEKRNGAIDKPVSYAYVWGDALQALNHLAPDVRIINLETSITTNNHYWPGKGIQYRMHPNNIDCLKAADIDICTLANNHVLDWNHEGLRQTLSSLHKANIQTAGAGVDLAEAQRPAVFEIPEKGRVLIFSFADSSSGTPNSWKASHQRAGVNLLDNLSDQTLYQLASHVSAIKRENDIVIASIHWGGNWGYDIDLQHRKFAHGLIEQAGFDIIHGHSSHHPKGIEVYKNKPIIYGCGDFLNDYEGISGQESYRGDLGFMYFLTINAKTGDLIRMQLIPTQIKQFRIHYADKADSLWLQQMMNREGQKLGSQVALENNELLLSW